MQLLKYIMNQMSSLFIEKNGQSNLSAWKYIALLWLILIIIVDIVLVAVDDIVKGQHSVGLVSFPGSGNTWVRSLLQEVTGICTGSQYCDSELRVRGFDGEGIESKSVLVVKSHSLKHIWSSRKTRLDRLRNSRKLFDHVILLIRNPFHALVSEWNRLLSRKYSPGEFQHTKSHNKKHFVDNPKWDDFVKHKIVIWMQYFYWLFDVPKGHDFLVIRYEDLKANGTVQVKKMLHFLQYDFPGKELNLDNNEHASLFKREQQDDFEHFTKQQAQLVNSILGSVITLLQRRSYSQYNLKEYFRDI